MFIGVRRLLVAVRLSGLPFASSEKPGEILSDGIHSSFALVSPISVSDAGNTSLADMVPVSSSAADVKSLKTEPGVYRPWTARLKSRRFTLSSFKAFHSSSGIPRAT
ncbi:unknown [Clostridium sp. CAG:1024]|nr:unknown [Clostridium sp. CAG:1024]